jgi:hypothetical protein
VRHVRSTTRHVNRTVAEKYRHISRRITGKYRRILSVASQCRNCCNVEPAGWQGNQSDQSGPLWRKQAQITCNDGRLFPPSVVSGYRCHHHCVCFFWRILTTVHIFCSVVTFIYGVTSIERISLLLSPVFIYGRMGFIYILLFVVVHIRVRTVRSV